MEEIVEIILRAVDEASNMFSDITSTAEDMGSSITDSADSGSSGLDTLESAAESATSSVQDVANAADGLEQEMGEADTAVQGLSDDLDIISSGMLLQTAEQIGSMGSNAEGMAQDMNTAAISVGQLATNVGMAEPQMVSLINTISNATFPQNEAMAYVNALNQMGVSSDKLGDAATNMDRINDATGIGYEKTMKLTQGLQSVGIEGDKLPSAFNAIAFAEANVNGGADTLQRTLMRQAATINEYGLNVDQLVLIMQKLSEQGVSSTKMGTELSKVLKENNGDLAAIEQQLGMTSGSLENATAVTGAYDGQLMQLASEEAEHKTLLDQLGAAWEDLSLSLSGVLSPLTSAIGLIGGIGSFGLQVKGLKELATTIPSIRTALAELNIVQAITTGEFWAMAAAELAALWPILAIIAAIALIAVAVFEVGKAFGWWTDIGSMIDAIWSGIQRLWSAFINHPDVQAAITAISNAVSTLWSWIQQAGQAVLNFFGINESGNFDIIHTLIVGIGKAWEALTLPIRTVIDYISNVIMILSDLVNGNITVLEAIGLLWNNFATLMSNVLQGLLTVAKTIWTAIWKFTINLVKGMILGIVNYFKGLIGKVRSALLSVRQTIINSIRAWITAAYNKVKELVDRILSPLKGVAGKISTALSGVDDAFAQPFISAWSKIEPYYGKIKQALQMSGGAVGYMFGGESAYGGESYSIGNSPVEVNQTVTLDFKNVPSHMDTNTLINALTDKTVLQALTGNSDFQSMDARVKNRLQMKVNRSRGI